MKFLIALCLLLTPSCSFAAGPHTGNHRDLLEQFDTTDHHPAWKETVGIVGDKFVELFLSRRRNLQPAERTRECGQVISQVSLEESVSLVSLLGDVFFGPGTPLEGFGPIVGQVLTESLKYGFQASVLCSSCEEIKQIYAGSEFLTDDEQYGFLSYCGDDVYGSNLTYRGLLLQPIDNTTNSIIQAKMKGAVFMITSTESEFAPSEVWPADIPGLLASEEPENILFTLYDTISAAIASSSGAISIVPDSLTYLQPKQYGIVNLYQQSAVPLYLKAQDMIKTDSQGCTELDSAASFGGYSIGGSAAVAVALAFERLGYGVIGVASGAAPFKTVQQLQWTIDRFDQGLPSQGNNILATGLVHTAHALSSTNPDLANTGTGQDMLADEWMDESNYTMNVKAWMADDLNQAELLELIPFPYPPEMIRDTVVSLMQDATVMGSTDPCASAQVGVTDKICEALIDNDLFQAVQDTTFPIVICHSPDDDVVSILSAPNTTANDNLSLFALGPVVASGTHAEAAGPCLFNIAFPYTAAYTGPPFTNDLQPVDGQCLAPTAPPTTASPTMAAPVASPPTSPLPTQAPTTGPPTTSSGHLLIPTAVSVLSVLYVTFLL